MRVGISRISQTPEEAYEVLAAAERHGFEGVQLKPSQYGEFLNSPEGFKQRYGSLVDLSCGGLIMYPGNDSSAWVGKAEAVLPFASAVGAEHICFCCGVYSTGASDEQVNEVAEVLTEVGERARQQNLIISIHNHVDSLVETEEDIARLLQRLAPEICSLTLDTAHAAKAGVSHVERLVVRFRHHLLNVHLKDLSAEGQFCALGQGTLPLRPILDALAAIKYDQWLIVDEETADLQTDEAFSIAAKFLQDRSILS